MSTIYRHNLARFAFRQQQESEVMRARIYDQLRARFNLPNATPQELEETARSAHNKSGEVYIDNYAVSLLEFARQLLVSNAALINAQLRVRPGHGSK